MIKLTAIGVALLIAAVATLGIHAGDVAFAGNTTPTATATATDTPTATATATTAATSTATTIPTSTTTPTTPTATVRAARTNTPSPTKTAVPTATSAPGQPTANVPSVVPTARGAGTEGVGVHLPDTGDGNSSNGFEATWLTIALGIAGLASIVGAIAFRKRAQ